MHELLNETYPYAVVGHRNRVEEGPRDESWRVHDPLSQDGASFPSSAVGARALFEHWLPLCTSLGMGDETSGCLRDPNELVMEYGISHRCGSARRCLSDC